MMQSKQAGFEAFGEVGAFHERHVGGVQGVLAFGVDVVGGLQFTVHS